MTNDETSSFYAAASQTQPSTSPLANAQLGENAPVHATPLSRRRDPKRLHALAALRRRLAALGPGAQLVDFKDGASKSSACALAGGHPKGASPWRTAQAGALTEIAGRDWRDGPAGEGYAYALALQQALKTPPERGGDIVWITLRALASEMGRPYGLLAYGGDHLTTEGLSNFGALPGTHTNYFSPLFCIAPDVQGLLWAAEEAVRSPHVAAVIIDGRKRHRRLDLTATRRLHLAAEKSGASAILLRAWDETAISAAARRFRVSPAPSAPRPFDAAAPGAPRWRVALERCRAGARGAWTVEWDHGVGTLKETPISRPDIALLADGPISARA